MSRKRFIKLLMSEGISRNEAVSTANYYHLRKFSYERAYKFHTGQVNTGKDTW